MTDLAGMETLAGLETRASSETGVFQTPDGLALFEQAWLPDRPPRAVVVLVHGYAEHSGRYGHLGAFLCAQGYAVCTYDLRGHGRSEGRRGFVDAFDRYLNDLGVYLRRVRQRFAGAPLFLMGHSLGGAICARFCIERRPDVAGLILSSPLLRVGVDIPPLLRRFSHVIAALFPTLPTIYLDRDDLSRDPAVVAAAKSDPLNFHDRIPARTGREMMRAGDQIRARLDAVTLPFLVFHGTYDRIADARGSVELYVRAVAEDKTLSLYEGLFHETLNEPEQTQILDELAYWLEEHL